MKEGARKKAPASQNVEGKYAWLRTCPGLRWELGVREVESGAQTKGMREAGVELRESRAI